MKWLLFVFDSLLYCKLFNCKEKMFLNFYISFRILLNIATIEDVEKEIKYSFYSYKAARLK